MLLGRVDESALSGLGLVEFPPIFGTVSEILCDRFLNSLIRVEILIIHRLHDLLCPTHPPRCPCREFIEHVRAPMSCRQDGRDRN
jgi:hypothetical protein